MRGWVARLRECATETGAPPAVFERIDELELRYSGQHWQGKRLIELSLAERDASKGSSVMKIASSELTQASPAAASTSVARSTRSTGAAGTSTTAS
jgi:hypothetical protein